MFKSLRSFLILKTDYEQFVLTFFLPTSSPTYRLYSNTQLEHEISQKKCRNIEIVTRLCVDGWFVHPCIVYT